MQILSHRGYWKTENERNKEVAFHRSFELGFGTETDIRDFNGKLVISHDMPHGDEITFENLLQIMNGRNLPLALNIKADGLVKDILRILNKYKHTNYFNFDMSIPDLIKHVKANATVYTGLSDILKQPVLIDKVQGIWLDSFLSDWYSEQKIDDLISSGKNVCIVSSELHNRKHENQWEIIKRSRFLNTNKLLLCTDYPEDAEVFFNE